MARRKSKRRKSSYSRGSRYERGGGYSSISRKWKRFRLWRWVLKWCFISTIWLFIIASVLFVYYVHDLPDTDKLHAKTRTPSITILAKDRSVVANYGDIYGDYVGYDDLPQTLIDAVISTEDRRFFDHFGVDVIGLLRAALANFRAGRVVQGGSTITQQLAKVSFLSPERTMKRKAQELLLAFYLEKEFSKEEILTMYLNRIYMGAGHYGVGAASRFYFGKPIAQVNLSEAAMLAGLIKAPSRYAPSVNRELAEKRADQVLENMVNNDVLTTEQLLRDPIELAMVTSKPKSDSKAHYFADWVKEQLSDYSSGYSGGITVVTTLDPQLQLFAENSLQRLLQKKGKKHHVTQGAIVVMSPDGEVLAMVGGKSYHQSQFNRVTQAYRQPGSAYKLFVYLAALEAGYTPQDILLDAPLDIDGWQPGNWDKRYRGEVPLRLALMHSINTATVRLAQDVGLKNIINVTHKLGVTSKVNYNLSSALGTSEMTLLELTGAYAHLANDGKSVWVHGINTIETAGNETLYKRTDASAGKVLNSRSVAAMNDMLHGVLKYGTGTEARFGRPAAGKTGTSQGSRDALFVGYTPDYVVGVWLGNDDNSSMQEVAGGSLAAELWKRVMKRVHKGTRKHDLPITEYSVEQGSKKGSLWTEFWSGFGEAKVDPDLEHKYPNSRN